MQSKEYLPDLSKMILFTIPALTGDTMYFLDEGMAYPLDENGIMGQGVEYPNHLSEYLFNNGLWVFKDYVKPISELEDYVDDEHEEEAEQVSDSNGHCITPEVGGAIKSDGGSSTYYDIPLPEWLVSRIVGRYLDGNGYIKTEELIEAMFQSDFDAGNALKSLVRLWGAFNGAGKEGNSVSYERKKIEYSVNKLEQRFDRLGAL